MFEFLKKVDLFAGLPKEDLLQICREAEERRLVAGEVLCKEGEPGDEAYVIQEGRLEVVKESDGREVLLAVRESGEVIGEMALLEEAPRVATIRAATECLLVVVDKETLDHLLATSISAANAMFRTILARWRGMEGMLRQSEKMAQLGTMSAGIAHELNNPAAAVTRSAGQLQAAIGVLGEADARLRKVSFAEEQDRAIADLAATLVDRKRPAELDALARSDREFELEDWLDDRGVEDAWELAPTLVNLGYETTDLDALAGDFTAGQLPAVIGWLSATVSADNLVSEIGSGAKRISDIVKALKSYSYLDQAPVQSVDLHEGLDDTLVILQHKLKSGIEVRREYAADLPKIEAYGSELNQVWTNLIDNAADAVGDTGRITLRTYLDGDKVTVEIEDNGPGIPEEIQSRIFDSFFTTKPPGKGTGLGLDISYNIVVHKHRGDIKLFSEPGKTRFLVELPLNFDA